MNGSAARAGIPITHRDQLPSSSRYELLVKIASGGMATVYVGRLSTVVGTSRLVAIKRAHAHLLEDPTFARALVAEAKLASRIHHPNVVAVQSVEEIEGELLLVMDYVEGASLSELAANEEMPLPSRVAVRALLDGCAGLQAAHELTDEDGHPLGIVHRDVSPHNILVGVDGMARLTDFGIAKSSAHTGSGRTTTGALKGKISYMAPEYVDSGVNDVRSDVFALGVVAWEMLTRQRLFRGATEMESLRLVLATQVPRPSEVAPWLGSALDAVVVKALAREPADRFGSAAELGDALETASRRVDLIATAKDVGAFVRRSAGDVLERRRALVRVPQLETEPVSGRTGDEDPTRSVPDSVEGARLLDGRLEDTASLGGAGSDVRVRESATGALPPAEVALDAATSVTLPFVDPALAAQAGAPPSDSAAVASAPSPIRPRRSRSAAVAMALTVAAAVGVAALVIPAVRARNAAVVEARLPSDRGASGGAPVISVPPPTTNADAPASGAAPVLVPVGSIPVASPSAHAAPSAPPAALPTPPRTVRTPGATRGTPASKPPPAPTETSGDRAPPNPYAH